MCKSAGKLAWCLGSISWLGERSVTDVRVAHSGEYSNEKLQQLRQQTKSMPGAPAAAKPVDTGGFKLSGSFKAAKKPADDRYEVSACDMVRLQGDGVEGHLWIFFQVNLIRANGTS